MSPNKTLLTHLILLIAIGLVIKFLPNVAPYVGPVLAGGNMFLASPLGGGTPSVVPPNQP